MRSLKSLFGTPAPAGQAKRRQHALFLSLAQSMFNVWVVKVGGSGVQHDGAARNGLQVAGQGIMQIAATQSEHLPSECITLQADFITWSPTCIL
jgi:hypothetical protein